MYSSTLDELETLRYSYFSYFLSVILYVNVLLTFFYTLQLLFFSFSSVKLLPYMNLHHPSLYHSSLLFTLSLISLVFGSLFLSLVFRSTLEVSVPPLQKSLPTVLLFFMLIVLYSLKIFPLFKSRLVFSY